MCETSFGLPGFKQSFRKVIKCVGFLYERNFRWKEELSGIVEINILGQWSAWQPLANLLFTLMKCLSIKEQSMSGDCLVKSVSVITRVWLSDCAIVQMVDHRTELRRPGCNPKQVHVGSVVDNFGSLLSLSFHQCSMPTHLSLLLYNLSSWHCLKLKHLKNIYPSKTFSWVYTEILYLMFSGLCIFLIVWMKIDQLDITWTDQ